MAGIVLEGVSRVYPGGVVAVDQLDLEVRDREFLVLVGPSGCGKSTTLRLIAGLEETSSGRICIGGREVNNVAPKDRDIAMVFQNYALYPHMTVYKNMAFGLELRYGGKWARRAWWRMTQPAKAAELAERRRGIGQRVRQAAGILGIEGLMSRLPGDLSGGERQRVALGRALVRQPAAFLLDEPLSNLDAKLRVEMRRELKQLHQRLAATMMYVTHDQVEALTLGDRVAVLDRGRLQQVGAPLEVYDRPANRFVASFIGTPPMNLIEGELRATEPDGWQFAAPAWSMAMKLPPAAAAWSQPARHGESLPVVLGIRPEDVRVVVDGRESEGQPTSGSLPGQVALVEPLGDSTVVHLALGAGQAQRPALVCKTDIRTAWRPGDRVRARFDLERVHWFSPRTGRNLACPDAPPGRELESRPAIGRECGILEQDH